MTDTKLAKNHNSLRRFTESEILENGSQILKLADQGIQTAVVTGNGSVQSVIGLNGIRYLPDPDPDPLDEIVSLALDALRKQ